MSRRYSLNPLLRFGKQKSIPKSIRKSKKRAEKKTYTLVDMRGMDIGGHYVSRTPKGAAKKAAKQYLPKNKAGKVKVCIRQTSLGKGHNRIRCYLVTQVMESLSGKKLPFWLDNTNNNRSRIPVKKAQELPLPIKLR